MERINLGGGVWFDADKARHFEEATHWDGQNHISNCTGSQFDHESLYATRSGGYNHYRQLSPAEAAVWLADNGHDEAAETAAPGSIAAAEL